MKKELTQEILAFIEENKEIYLEFLTNFNGFPYICDYSSEILGAYLSSKFNTEIYMIEGNFDYNEDLGHYWIEIDNTIVDFTLSQFFISSKAYEVAINDNLLYKLIENTTPFPLINDKIWKDRYEYLDEISLSQELIDIANLSNSFNEYLNNVKPLYNGLIK